LSQAIPTPIASPAEPVEPVGRRSLASRFGGLAFIAPALVVLGLFLVYPAYYTIRLSFYQSNFLFGFTHWVGLDNFKNLLTNDPDFLDTTKFHGFKNIVEELVYKNDAGALINNLHWVVFYITFALALGLGFAVLAVRVRYERVIKSVVFVPMAIAATAVGIIWLFVYSPDINQGVLDAILHALHPHISWLHPVSWMGNTKAVNYALIFAYIWASTGFVMVVLSAAIKGIPSEILEAARADGAGEWAIFWRIIVPMLSLPISIVTIWLFINVIKLFDLIYVMTGGGPGTSSRVIAFTMYYESFPNGQPGYGAAVAVIMLILVLPVMIVNVRRFRTSRVVG
jgi:alpha-glucoside transport system permease protein